MEMSSAFLIKVGVRKKCEKMDTSFKYVEIVERIQPSVTLNNPKLIPETPDRSLNPKVLKHPLSEDDVP